MSVPRSTSDVGPVGWSFLLRSVPVSSLCCSFPRDIDRVRVCVLCTRLCTAIQLLDRKTLSVSNLLWCEISDVLQIVVNNQSVKSGGFSDRPSRSPERQPGLNSVQTPRETDHRVGEHSVVVNSVGDRTMIKGLGTTTEGGRTQEVSFGSLVSLQEAWCGNFRSRLGFGMNSKYRTPELTISVELQEYIQGGLVHERPREADHHWLAIAIELSVQFQKIPMCRCRSGHTYASRPPSER